MEDSIKAVDCEGGGQQSDTPGNPSVLPTADSLCEILKDELRCATFCKYRQGDNSDDEEQKVTESTNKLKGVEEFPEPQVQDEGQKD